MADRRNATIAISRFLAYKNDLNKRMENMTDEQFAEHPIGFEVGRYVEDMMKYCSESTVDTVLKHQDDLILRLGENYLSIVAFMPYAGGGEAYAGQQTKQ
jgi:hypothetical protein